MTHIRQNGFSLSLILFTIILMLTSCNSSHLLQRHERIIREFNTYYFNDSIQFSYILPGDYKQFAKRSVAVREFKKINTHIKNKYLVTGFSTIISPYFEHYLLYFPDSASLIRNFRKNDKSITINGDNIKYCTIDSIHKMAYNIFKLNNRKGFILILAKSHPNEFLGSFINEYYDIFKSVKYNSDYLDNYKIDLFKIANNAFYNTDSTPNYLKPIIELTEKSKNLNIDKNQYIQVAATYQSFIANSRDLEGLIQQFREST